MGAAVMLCFCREIKVVALQKRSRPMAAALQKGSRRGGDLLPFDSEKRACSRQTARSMLVAVARVGNQGDAASREGEEDGGRRGQLETPGLHRGGCRGGDGCYGWGDRQRWLRLDANHWKREGETVTLRLAASLISAEEEEMRAMREVLRSFASASTPSAIVGAAKSAGNDEILLSAVLSVTAALHKLCVYCPGLLRDGVLLENSDFGLERDIGSHRFIHLCRDPPSATTSRATALVLRSSTSSAAASSTPMATGGPSSATTSPTQPDPSPGPPPAPSRSVAPPSASLTASPPFAVLSSPPHLRLRRRPPLPPVQHSLASLWSPKPSSDLRSPTPLSSSFSLDTQH
ncbi:hypothetical protein BHE74_00032609 [Ensete ventricosum]|nr:hypothetical protein BHE74_00032609 [Ensete ventricosum]